MQECREWTDNHKLFSHADLDGPISPMLSVFVVNSRQPFLLGLMTHHRMPSLRLRIRFEGGRRTAVTLLPVSDYNNGLNLVSRLQ